MADRASSLKQLMIIAADALETVKTARERRFEVAKQIARSDQALDESRQVVERADESLRRLSAPERRPSNDPDRDLRTFDARGATIRSR
jgi:hypothetical protein